MTAPSSFPETVWSDVLAAADCSDSVGAREAVVRLCERYHGAIRAWFRRQPQTREMADDLAQEFLMRWLVREAPLGEFRRGPRRFREFLATCLRRFGVAEHARRTAQKRGGGVVHVAWEDVEPEGAGGAEESVDLELARDLQREVDAGLEVRWRSRVPAGGWERLRDMALGWDEATGYAPFAAELGIPVGTVKGWVFRLRQEHYEEFLRRVRSLTVPTETAEEVRHLLELLARHGSGRESR